MSNSKRNLEAFKAVIYCEGGELLLQQRDNTPNLPFPGAWNFFGGHIEEGELPKDALIRELTEELGVIPGEMRNYRSNSGYFLAQIKSRVQI